MVLTIKSSLVDTDFTFLVTKSSFGENEKLKIEEMNSDEDSGNSSANSSHEDAKKHLQFQVF